MLINSHNREYQWRYKYRDNILAHSVDYDELHYNVSQQPVVQVQMVGQQNYVVQGQQQPVEQQAYVVQEKPAV